MVFVFLFGVESLKLILEGLLCLLLSNRLSLTIVYIFIDLVVLSLLSVLFSGGFFCVVVGSLNTKHSVNFHLLAKRRPLRQYCNYGSPRPHGRPSQLEKYCDYEHRVNYSRGSGS